MTSSIVSPSHSTLLFSKNDHILETYLRTTIFWIPIQERPYSGYQAWIKPDIQHYYYYTIVFIKICLDPTKDSWWWKVVRLTSIQVGVYLAIFLIYLAIFTYLPGHFFLSTWPLFVSTWLHPPRIRPQLPQHIVHRRRFRHYNTIQYLDLPDIVPLQYSTWTCRIHLPSTLQLLLAFSQYFSNRPLHCLTKLS